MICRAKLAEDNLWIIEKLKENWGSEIIVTRNTKHSCIDLEGVIIENENRIIGLCLYEIVENELEIVLIETYIEKLGVGSFIINEIRQIGIGKGIERIWLITTNDNIDALRFYQRRGFVLKALYKDAIKESRKLKPEIPMLGENGIEIRDEIEMEMVIRTE